MSTILEVLRRTRGWFTRTVLPGTGTERPSNSSRDIRTSRTRRKGQALSLATLAGCAHKNGRNKVGEMPRAPCAPGDVLGSGLSRLLHPGHQS